MRPSSAELLEFARPGHSYTRYSNPTHEALEAAIAELEGAEAGLVTASGMAAIHGGDPVDPASGDELLIPRAVYGGVIGLARVGARSLRDRHRGGRHDRSRGRRGGDRPADPPGVARDDQQPHHGDGRYRRARGTRARAAASWWPWTTRSPRLRWRRLSPSAPMSSCTPPRSTSAAIPTSSAAIVVGVGGAGIGGSQDRDQRRRQRVAVGGVPGPAWPEDAGAAHGAPHDERPGRGAGARGCSGGRGRPLPGLAEHPQHELACRVLRDGMAGGMLAVELEGGRPHGERFLERMRVAVHATSLGGVETLVSHPASSSHRQLSEDGLAAAGLTPGTLRVSIGLEDADDLVADLVGRRGWLMAASQRCAARRRRRGSLVRAARSACCACWATHGWASCCCCWWAVANAVGGASPGRPIAARGVAYALLLGALALTSIAALAVRAPATWREWRRPGPVTGAGALRATVAARDSAGDCGGACATPATERASWAAAPRRHPGHGPSTGCAAAGRASRPRRATLASS